MTSLKRLFPTVGVMLLIAGFGAGVAAADSSHARIVRLSQVQGDVRFTRDVKGDPLNDSRSGWEGAVLNLPIRQGYVVATDAGRAEVEFENGAMAFLAENTMLEFYDLSSEDGGFTTRLILRQGSAEFYVQPGRGDYFSVTGGDFSVQAETRTTFRMNNFDNGSSVNVLQGRLTALVNGKNSLLHKGQSLSLQAGEPDSMAVDQAPAADDFDQWVSGRIETASAATNAGVQYANSNNYTSGFGDLYTYGAWIPVAGFGNCWRPFGVGFGWSPFDYGSWYYDPFFGWSFIGGQPWGWLPYHYGGWLFRPGVGWVWSPTGSFGSGGVGRYRPVTGVWVKSGGSVGIVPRHPLDVKGKTPVNMSAGVFAVTTRGVTGRVTVDDAAKWKVESKPARELMQNQLAEVAAPARLSRTMVASRGTVGTGAPTAGRESAIVYDRSERKFVNSNTAQSAERSAVERSENTSVAPGRVTTAGGERTRIPTVENRNGNATVQIPAVPPARSVSPPRATLPPPSVPRSVTVQRSFNEGGGSGRSGGGGSAGSSGSARSSSSSSSGTSAASSGSSGRSTSSGSSGGGRPH